METNLLDRMLNTYLTSQTPVVITLQNKVRITGRIKAFDSYIVLMDGNKREIVYRHAMSSVTPSVEDSKKQPAPASRAAQPKAPIRQTQAAATKSASKPHNGTAAPSGPSESSINTSMKEGLLKWMQEQKAAK